MLIIGATTAFFMGLLGIVNNDIKRVIAYSTLSQLGYMTVALGVSAYGAGIFHLMTHAFFKALLFLAAGSVIIAMHHEQDMRKMGGLRKYMPITYWTCLVGCAGADRLSRHRGLLFQGFADRCGARVASRGLGYAYFCVLTGVFITALYTFRMFFMTFHGKERMDHHTQEHLHESPWVVTRAADAAGHSVGADRLVHGQADAVRRISSRAPFMCCPRNDVLSRWARSFTARPARSSWSAFGALPVWLAASGVLTAYVFFLQEAGAGGCRGALASSGCTRILVDKYGFDWFNEHVIVAGARSAWAAACGASAIRS